MRDRRSRLRLLTSIALWVLAGCGSHSPVSLPPRLAGQIPDDYRLEPSRALVIARVDVFTQDQAGFGAITNPMLLQFHEGEGTPTQRPQDLTMTNPDARVFGSDADRPMLWRYRPPGLLAVSVRPGIYDGLVVAYPDTSHPNRPDSIPAPDRAMAFAPLEIRPDTIVYVGDLQVRQHYSGTDLLFDRVRMDYGLIDRCEQTIADFRARYPQFKDTTIETRLAVPVAAGD